jgi:hypothetical protein
VTDVFISLFLFYDSTTASTEEGWYWTAANAITNAAYGEDVEVPEFVWRWFNSGDEIPKDYPYWANGEPRQGFDTHYQTYRGCAAVYKPKAGDWSLKTFSCQTPLPYLCQTIWEV